RQRAGSVTLRSAEYHCLHDHNDNVGDQRTADSGTHEVRLQRSSAVSRRDMYRSSGSVYRRNHSLLDYSNLRTVGAILEPQWYASMGESDESHLAFLLRAGNRPVGGAR